MFKVGQIVKGITSNLYCLVTAVDPGGTMDIRYLQTGPTNAAGSEHTSIPMTSYVPAVPDSWYTNQPNLTADEINALNVALGYDTYDSYNPTATHMLKTGGHHCISFLNNPGDLEFVEWERFQEILDLAPPGVADPDLWYGEIPEAWRDWPVSTLKWVNHLLDGDQGMSFDSATDRTWWYNDPGMSRVIKRRSDRSNVPSLTSRTELTQAEFVTKLVDLGFKVADPNYTSPLPEHWAVTVPPRPDRLDIIKHIVAATGLTGINLNWYTNSTRLGSHIGLSRNAGSNTDAFTANATIIPGDWVPRDECVRYEFDEFLTLIGYEPPPRLGWVDDFDLFTCRVPEEHQALFAAVVKNSFGLDTNGLTGSVVVSPSGVSQTPGGATNHWLPAVVSQGARLQLSARLSGIKEYLDDLDFTHTGSDIFYGYLVGYHVGSKMRLNPIGSWTSSPMYTKIDAAVLLSDRPELRDWKDGGWYVRLPASLSSAELHKLHKKVFGNTTIPGHYDLFQPGNFMWVENGCFNGSATAPLVDVAECEWAQLIKPLPLTKHKLKTMKWKVTVPERMAADQVEHLGSLIMKSLDLYQDFDLSRADPSTTRIFYKETNSEYLYLYHAVGADYQEIEWKEFFKVLGVNPNSRPISSLNKVVTESYEQFKSKVKAGFELETQWTGGVCVRPDDWDEERIETALTQAVNARRSNPDYIFRFIKRLYPNSHLAAMGSGGFRSYCNTSCYNDIVSLSKDLGKSPDDLVERFREYLRTRLIRDPDDFGLDGHTERHLDVFNSKGYPNLVCGTDGSVAGVEIRTEGPLTYSEWMQALVTTFKYDHEIDDECSFHIHLSIPDYVPKGTSLVRRCTQYLLTHLDQIPQGVRERWARNGEYYRIDGDGGAKYSFIHRHERFDTLEFRCFGNIKTAKDAKICFDLAIRALYSAVHQELGHEPAYDIKSRHWVDAMTDAVTKGQCPTKTLDLHEGLRQMVTSKRADVVKLMADGGEQADPVGKISLGTVVPF